MRDADAGGDVPGPCRPRSERAGGGRDVPVPLSLAGAGAGEAIMDARHACYLRAKNIVEVADGLPPEERADYVERECAGDAALLAEVAWMRKAVASETTLPAPRRAKAEPTELAGGQQFAVADCE